MLQLTWVRRFAGTNDWIDLHKVDLDKVHVFGVYVIWCGGQPSQVVRVGQGNIAERLRCHRDDKDVQAYRARGLYVMWAAVSALQVDGVERHLAEEYPPLVGDRWPDADPIAVNSPFAA